MELADQTDHPLADHAVIDQPDAAGPVDHQRNHGLGKDHVGPQGQERDVTRLQGLIGVPLGQHDELSRVGLGPAGVGDSRALGAPTLPWIRCLFSS